MALARLDSLGLPVATAVLPGDRADDPLYVPLVQRARSTVAQRGLLYVGDCKMGALRTRATIHHRARLLLVPLGRDAGRARDAGPLSGPGACQWVPPERIERLQPDGTTEHLADSYACTETLTAVVDGWQSVTWTEQRLLLRSVSLAQSQETASLWHASAAHPIPGPVWLGQRAAARASTSGAQARGSSSSASIRSWIKTPQGEGRIPPPRPTAACAGASARAAARAFRCRPGAPPCGPAPGPAAPPTLMITVGGILGSSHSSHRCIPCTLI
jgi:hypothetical protein